MKRLLLLSLATVIAGCGTTPKKDPAAGWDPIQLDQRWSAATSQHYWWTSQGSQVVPYDYITALELKDSQELFASAAHFDRLRFVNVAGKSAANPGGLPIGLVKNQAQVDGQDVMGLTCAACHTAKWKINGVDVIIEGGPSKGDFQMFFNELIDSMTQTIDQPEKFDRFAKRAGGDAAALKDSVTKWRDRLAARKIRNPIPADNQPGFGRDDAFNKLVNEITSGDLGIPENAGVANAAASIAHVWDAPQHDVVQWNGAIPNAGPGPAIRNIGEVLGVYGTIDITPAVGKWPEYPVTSAETKNLNAIEQDLWALSSPKWPETLLPIDKTLAAAGRPIFSEHCGSCHLPIDRTNPSRRVVAQMLDVETDPAINQAASRRVKTGRLRGTPKLLNPKDVFQAEDSALDVMVNAVFGAYRAHRGDFRLITLVGLNEVRRSSSVLTAGRFIDALGGDVKQAVVDFQTAASAVKQALQLTGNTNRPPTNNYKARPLNGIWATGPYLHNGSVLNLTELLKQDKDRVKEFYVGSWVLDPVNVGVTSVAEEGGVPLYLYKTNLTGNTNTGHNFGTDLTADQKKQLIEYINTL
jgi:mono/diheme cytochrome c family protein